jgi:twitching motility protein PilU
MKIFDFLMCMEKNNASDLYLTADFPPSMRVDNNLVPIQDSPLTKEDLLEFLKNILTTRQLREFDASSELNTSIDLKENGRFRINVLLQRQTPAIVIRRIISVIPTFEQLGLPPILRNLIMKKRGLVLLTGMTGSGKTTTLASMIDYRNKLQSGHIITIEDPIEYYHAHQKSIISQREVGVDTQSYFIALTNALRQRPDVILIGEIRERNVMEQVLAASETGHLCLSTLHANNAYQAIERIVNMFPVEHIEQVRMHLSVNLNAIISQRLVVARDGHLVMVSEVFINEGLSRELILKGQISKIKEFIEQNTHIGMQSFDQSLLNLYALGRIDAKTAIAQSDQSADMKIKIQSLDLSRDSMSSVDTSLLRLSE